MNLGARSDSKQGRIRVIEREYIYESPEDFKKLHGSYLPSEPGYSTSPSISVQHKTYKESQENRQQLSFFFKDEYEENNKSFENFLNETKLDGEVFIEKPTEASKPSNVMEELNKAYYRIKGEHQRTTTSNSKKDNSFFIEENSDYVKSNSHDSFFSMDSGISDNQQTKKKFKMNFSF
ncbi:unnamed protein product [Lepeophtheirus salmonis]|uniref:(salmon louse) hypothetical protein n=2 Tax=Lepeophtheirus salmonis TaxID=72036 RepID=A0A7R8D6G7_LEPSM|nr:unnamed protein product [Lepeophtheirus salmonis]CAF2989474.1 unnamed protein product [Lepeophtheirus salmonis]